MFLSKGDLPMVELLLSLGLLEVTPHSHGNDVGSSRDNNTLDETKLREYVWKAANLVTPLFFSSLLLSLYF